MESRNWDEFRYLSNAGESKYYDKKYYPADCLQPGLYVNIFTTYTDTDALLQTYRRIVDFVGDKMRDYRHVGSYTLPIRNLSEALEKFPRDLINSEKTGAHCELEEKYGGVFGNEDTPPAYIGGVGCAGISIHQEKSTPESWQEKVAVYGDDLKKGKVAYYGPYISRIHVRMPVDQFTESQAFLNWVLSLEILQSPSLFSATAGYCLEEYIRDNRLGSPMKEVEKILTTHPGFEYRLGRNEIRMEGLIYLKDHGILKPQLYRINWLNALSKDAFLVYPGGREGLNEAAKQWPEIVLHPLKNGVLIQAGEEPGIGDDGLAPEPYCSAGKLLERFYKCSPSSEAYSNLWI